MPSIDENIYFETKVRETFIFKNKYINYLFDIISGKYLFMRQYKYNNIIKILPWTSFIFILFISPYMHYVFLIYISIFSVGFFRTLQVVHMHHCIHQTFFKRNNMNRIYVQFISGFVICSGYKIYKKEHINHHRKHIFTTEKDADAKLLLDLGFMSGKSKGYYHKNLIKNMLGLKFHAKITRGRFSSMIKCYDKYTFLGNIAILSIYAVMLKVSIYALIVLLWIPQFVLYNVSAILQFLTEHAWFDKGHPPKNIEEYKERCWGRFAGTKLERSFMGYIYWILHMTFLAIPYRFGVIVGDLPVHDWHHLCGYAGGVCQNWQQYMSDRQESILNGDPLDLAQREVWGLKNALQLVFDRMSHAYERKDFKK